MRGRKETIIEKVRVHHEYVKEKGHYPVYTALYGSQNYNLDDEHSDIDTETIVLPSWLELFKGTGRISQTHYREDDHVNIKDLALMSHMWSKQSLASLELLFTEYYYVEPRYAEAFRLLREGAEIIAQGNSKKLLAGLLGMATNSQKRLNRYDRSREGKEYANLLRLKAFVEEWVVENSFAKSLKIENKQIREKILEVKRQDKISNEDRASTILLVNSIMSTIQDFERKRGIISSSSNILLDKYFPIVYAIKLKEDRGFRS